MIAPQELRLGNLVTDSTGRVLTILELLESYARVYRIRKEWWSSTSYEELKPIQLTEDWLKKFGFKRRHDQKYYHEKYDTTWVEIKSILVKWYGNYDGEIKMFDYVHELQNVFKIMTGEELTIKES